MTNETIIKLISIAISPHLFITYFSVLRCLYIISRNLQAIFFGSVHIKRLDIVIPFVHA